FASLGSCSLGDFDIVKKNLLLFLKYQKENGQLPRRVDRYIVGLKYLRIPIKRGRLHPRYTTSLLYCYSVDQNSLFIISLLEYIKANKDKDFLRKNYDRIKKAIDWNFSNDQERDLLIEEGFFANWEDTVFWRGKLLYTNVLHYWALKSFAELARIAGEKDHKRYLDTAENVKKKINEQFWNGQYYEKTSRKIIHYFCIDANMLAIVSGIADSKKAKKIMEYMKKCGLDKEIPLRSTYPKYPLWRNSPARLVTLSTGYQNTYEWIWVSCLDILAKQKSGMKKEAIVKFKRLCKKIIEFDGVYEVYSDGRPVKGIFLMSDCPFAWSAGMFVYIYYKIHTKD
ncbi:MAG: GH116 family glycosyl hydrolase, partial [Candidatus Woesearchaeota archaeon]|nr:GH116 family glycosyl hydrolase [Candidatus Woesearchaeota archaeon]